MEALSMTSRLAPPLIIALVLAGCGGGDGPDDPGARYLDLERRAIAVVVGDSAQFVAVGYDSSFNSVPVSGVRWLSEDTTVATIDQRGVVRSRRAGSAGIQAQMGSLIAYGYIEVRKPVSAIQVLLPAGPHVRNAAFGVTYKLFAPDGSETWRDTGFVWTSSAPDVARIQNEFGSINVTPLAPGTAMITISVEGITGSAPVEVISLAWRWVDPGSSRVCGLDDASRAFCYGGPGDGFPRIVGGGHRFDSLSTGAQHICALETGGKAWCWPGNGSELGAGTSGPPSPDPVAVAGEYRFTSIQAPKRVAMTCALALSGELYCWGSNEWGAFGTGTNIGSSVPSRAAPGLLFTRFSLGGRHACGIVADGGMYCWGANESGQAGRNLTISISPDPRPVYGTLRFADVAAGFQDTCALTVDSEVWCWGYRAHPAEPYRDSIPVKRTGAPALASLHGGTDTWCGLTPAGSAWCWGDGFDWTPSALPSGSNLQTLSVGDERVCATTADGKAYCWPIHGPHVREEQPH
jgi:alpha-tubulin suppressor-like RCC1 family protein